MGKRPTDLKMERLLRYRVHGYFETKDWMEWLIGNSDSKTDGNNPKAPNQRSGSRIYVGYL